eukprot:jgi/Botrbrau1/22618/Bobra.176_1s0047.1
MALTDIMLYLCMWAAWRISEVVIFCLLRQCELHKCSMYTGWAAVVSCCSIS